MILSLNRSIITKYLKFFANYYSKFGLEINETDGIFDFNGERSK